VKITLTILALIASAAATAASAAAPTPLVTASSLRLQPGHLYRTTFTPAATFRVPTTNWWAYQRDVTAFNLRKATGPADSQIVSDEAIETALGPGTLAGALKAARNVPGLHETPVSVTRVGPYPARRFDGIPTKTVTWAGPPALAGMSIDPSDRVRVYVFATGRTAVVALVIAKSDKLPSFLPQAEKTLASMRVG